MKPFLSELTMRKTIPRALFAFAATIFLVFTTIPRPPAIALLLNDKLEHVATFFALSVLGCFGWPQRSTLVPLLLGAFGAAIELLQGLAIIHRDMSMGDWIADVCGIGLGIAAVAACRAAADQIIK